MRDATDETSHVLHVIERDTRLKSVPTTAIKDENCSVAIVKAISTKENPVAINEGTQ